MNFECVCGKVYRFKSGLCRHQRGSTSDGILPCPVFAGEVVSPHSTLAERLVEALEKAETRHNKIILDYSQSSLIVPVEVGISGDVRNPDDVVRMPAQLLKEVHFNEKLPFLQNVKLTNRNSTVRIREGQQWVQQGFNAWANDYVLRAIPLIFRFFSLDTDEKEEITRTLCERRKEVLFHIKTKLTTSKP